MLFSNIDHCPMVEVASLAVYMFRHWRPWIQSICLLHSPPSVPRPGKKSSVEFYLTNFGWIAMQKSRELPSQWLGLRRKGRMAACTQNGLTHWNNSRMDSFTLLKNLPQCNQLNTFLKMYRISVASGQGSDCVRRGGWYELLSCI